MWPGLERRRGALTPRARAELPLRLIFEDFTEDLYGRYPALQG